jgi:two-component system OmpR family response regulator
MRILLVEDEAKMARLVQRGLREEGHQVDHCVDGATALDQALGAPYDVIVLDWALPDVDGVSLLRSWRDRGLHTAVLMLTARGTVGERITGLRAGADDYLVKPFDFDELMARLDSLHRRSGGHEPRRRLGSLTLDANRHALVIGKAEQVLTAREWALLSELAGHAGEVMTRSELLSAVWGSAFDGAPNVVDVYVGYLRAKLRKLGASEVQIDAVRGVGFRLTVQRPERER